MLITNRKKQQHQRHLRQQSKLSRPLSMEALERLKRQVRGERERVCESEREREREKEKESDCSALAGWRVCACADLPGAQAGGGEREERHPGGAPAVHCPAAAHETRRETEREERGEKQAH